MKKFYFLQRFISMKFISMAKIEFETKKPWLETNGVSRRKAMVLFYDG